MSASIENRPEHSPTTPPDTRPAPFQRRIGRRVIGGYAAALAGLIAAAIAPQPAPVAAKKKKTCPKGRIRCGKGCVDPSTDRKNCGKCGTACTGGLQCVKGKCGCTGGKKACGTACYDLQTNVKRCGSCANQCNPAVADTCANGACKCGAGPACSGSGVRCVNGQCLNLTVCPTCAFTTVQAAVDAAPAGATISIAAGTYEGLVIIDKSLTLSGAGKTSTILTRNDPAYGTSVFGSIITTRPGTTVRIQDLKITGGKATGGSGVNDGLGGGISNYGVLTLARCDVSSNAARNIGGGIYSPGFATLTLIDTDVKSNTCTGTFGGGIYGDGPLSITNGVISGNSVTGDNGIGGGISASRAFTATNVTVSQNASSLVGGGIHLQAPYGEAATVAWSLIDCDIEGNDSGSSGGGIFADGYILANGSSPAGATLSISGATTIRNNTAAFGGGGLEILRGCATSLNGTSSITGNSVPYPSGGGAGASISSTDSITTLTMNDASVISGNSLTCTSGCGGGGGGAGVYVGGDSSGLTYGRLVMNGTSAIKDNTATYFSGGGIRNLGRVELSPNCRVTGNTAAFGGGISTGGIFAPNAVLTGNTASNVTNNTPDNVNP